jgi:hypothetical protein
MNLQFPILTADFILIFMRKASFKVGKTRRLTHFTAAYPTANVPRMYEVSADYIVYLFNLLVTDTIFSSGTPEAGSRQRLKELPV